MANFPGLSLTTRGRNLLAKAQMGTPLEFTRVALGSGEWPEEQNPEDLTALVDEELTLSIQDHEVTGTGTSRIRVVFTNSGLETGFFAREIGIFATDPDLGEVLYCVSSAGDEYDFIPAGGGATTIEKQFDLYAVVGNATTVTAVISELIVVATKQDIDDHNTSATAHEDLRDLLSAHETSTTTAHDIAGQISSSIGDHDGSTSAHGDIRDSFVTKANLQAGIHVFAADTGSINAYAISPTPAVGAYTAGMTLCFIAANTNTGASTLSVSGLTAMSLLRPNGGALQAGDIVAGGYYSCLYNGSTFLLGHVTSGHSNTAVLSVNNSFGHTLPGWIVYNGNNTYTLTSPYPIGRVYVQIWGAGGGGAGGTSAYNTWAGGGGGGGAYAEGWILATPGVSVVVTIGTCGVGGSPGSSGGGGGTTSWGSFVSCAGGSGGVMSGTPGSGQAAGGTVSGGSGLFVVGGGIGSPILYANPAFSSGGYGGGSWGIPCGVPSSYTPSGAYSIAAGGNGAGGAGLNYSGGNGGHGLVILNW